MRKLLVFQHVAVEVLGTLDPLFRASGFRIRYVNFGRHPDAHPSLESYRGLVVLGGPMNVDETTRYPHIETEVELIREAVDRGMPILGICLGAQLIAKALGARVYKNGETEIGWYEVTPTPEAADDAMFQHMRPAENLFQWHGDTFDIPDGAVRLASSAKCANQAFRFGDRIYALQFHLEVDEPLIERWLHVPAYREELASVHGSAGLDLVRGDTAEHVDRLVQLSRRCFGEFVGGFHLPTKRHALPSR